MGNAPSGYKPGPLFDAALETLRTGKPVLPRDGIAIPDMPAVFDGPGSDNIPMTIAVYRAAVAWTKKDWPTVDRALGLFDTYLDSKLMADEQFSRNVYGDLVVVGVMILCGLAYLRGRSATVAKTRQRFGQPLLAVIALSSASAPAHLVGDDSPDQFPAHGILADGALVGPLLLGVALVGRRSWVKMDTNRDGSRDTFHGLDSPLYSAVLRWALGGKGDGKGAVEQGLAILLSRFGGAPPWGLSTADLAPAIAYCRDRTSRSAADALALQLNQNLPKIGMTLRRYQHGVLTAMEDAPGGSTATLGLDVRVEVGFQYLGKVRPAGAGILASPLSGGRENSADPFSVAFVGDEVRLSGPDKPFDVSVPLPTEIGPLLWEIKWGGGKPVTIDGQPVGAVASPSPSPSTGGAGKAALAGAAAGGAAGAGGCHGALLVPALAAGGGWEAIVGIALGAAAVVGLYFFLAGLGESSRQRSRARLARGPR